MEQLKLSIIGDAGTGKTQFLRTISGEQIKTEEYGQNIASEDYEINGELYRLTFWDLPAQQRFETVRRTFYNGSNAVLVLFDLTRRSSFIELHKWVKEVASTLHYIPVIALIGAKNDLADYHEIGEDEVEAIAKKFALDYYLLSALSKEEIDASIKDLIKKIVDRKEEK